MRSSRAANFFWGEGYFVYVGTPSSTLSTSSVQLVVYGVFHVCCQHHKLIIFCLLFVMYIQRHPSACLLPSYTCHPSFVSWGHRLCLSSASSVCQLPFAAFNLPCVVCRLCLSSVVFRMLISVCHSPSVISHLSSILFRLSVVCSLAVPCRLSSAICRLPADVCGLPSNVSAGRYQPFLTSVLPVSSSVSLMVAGRPAQ